MGFVHLHLHTQYSLLDGAIKLGDLIDRAKEFKMDSVAVTDHGNMYAAIKFYKAAKKAGIKPIIGTEAYICPSGRQDRSDRSAYHLILLARTNEGYHNLCRLSSQAFLEGFYYKPRMDYELLKQYSAGLTCTSACLGGEVAQAILGDDMDKALAIARRYQEIFGKEHYYLELQYNGLPEQEKVNQALLNMHELYGFPVVATNDCHYLNQEDATAHEVLMAIQTGKTMDEENRMSHSTTEFYLKSEEVMRSQFRGLEHALDATEQIAASVDLELTLDVPKLPRFVAPTGESLDIYLERKTRDGVARRLKDSKISEPERIEDYERRMVHEIEVIKKMGYPDYFLIVADFIAWAKENGIPVGPGRGSGAGSLVAYALGITNIDPLRFGLLFERFLNPERVSLPDFDVDFCKDKRDKVIEYVTDKYGKDRVGQIITYSSLNARGVIKDVGRALGFGFAEANTITKLIPGELGITLPKALEKEPKLQELINSDAKIKNLFNISQVLEGLNRHAGVHAAGIVIGQDPLLDICPLCRTQDGDVVTQYAKDEAEAVGLVKFDFLGLKTLTVIDVALKLISEVQGIDIDLDTLPLDDKAVYDLISSGETTGLFQMESSGFRDLLRRLRPDCIEDIIAVLALYRPGPLEGGMVADFVARKRGEVKVSYPHPDLEAILKETYGVVVYQEQVMQIAVTIAGYSLGRADILRKAMGKKKKELIEKERAPFIENAIKRGYDKKLVEELFDLLEKFARYGFNKSHSAAYAIVSFQTTYLKAHYPVEFVCANMTCDMGVVEKMVPYVAEARRLGINVRVPDINHSKRGFWIVEGEILVGLGGVKNVGDSAIEAIIEARDEGGPYRSLTDFCERVDLRRVNRRVIESLIQAGAFDSLGVNRARLFDKLDEVLVRAQKARKQASTGQLSLFGGGSQAVEADDPLEQLRGIPMEPAELKQFIAKEKEALGYFLSAHPLDAYMADIRSFGGHQTSDIPEVSADRPVRVAGVVSGLKEKLQKNGGRMARFQLEDQNGFVEVLAFSKNFEPAAELIRGEEPIVVEGTIMLDGDDEESIHRIRAENVLSFYDCRMRHCRSVWITLEEGKHRPEDLVALKQVLEDHPGEVPVSLKIDVPGVGAAAIPLSSEYYVNPSEEWLAGVQKAVGTGCIRYEKKSGDEWLSRAPKPRRFHNN